MQEKYDKIIPLNTEVYLEDLNNLSQSMMGISEEEELIREIEITLCEYGAIEYLVKTKNDEVFELEVQEIITFITKCMASEENSDGAVDIDNASECVISSVKLKYNGFDYSIEPINLEGTIVSTKRDSLSGAYRLIKEVLFQLI